MLLVDHEALRRKEVRNRLTAMGALVESVFLPVSEATGVTSATSAGDIAVVRSEHPDGAAVEAVNRMRELGWPRVIVVGADPDPFAVSDVLVAGARGYVAVAPLAVIEPAADEQGSRKTVGWPPIPKGVPRSFSRREVGILQEVADGKTNREIAMALGLSPHTVKSHLARIGQKLRTGDRAQMVLLALRSGAIQ